MRRYPGTYPTPSQATGPVGTFPPSQTSLNPSSSSDTDIRVVPTNEHHPGRAVNKLLLQPGNFNVESMDTVKQTTDTVPCL